MAPPEGAAQAPAPAAPPQMLPQTEMSRLVIFRGNNKDTVTPEAWAEMVDRHITVLKWSPEQTAGAAIEAMRDDANLWRENLADHEVKSAIHKNWVDFRKEFLKRFGKPKNRTAQIQDLGQLKQAGGEGLFSYLDRVQRVLNKLTKETLKEHEDAAEKKGFNSCKNLIESSLFLNGLRNDIKLYVDLELQQKPKATAEEIYALARETEIVMNSRAAHKAHAVDVSERKMDNLSAELERVKNAINKGEANNQTVAAIGKGKPKPKGEPSPIHKRRRPTICFKCRQWGLHYAKECKLTADEIARLTPQTKDDKPTGQVFDAQYPN